MAAEENITSTHHGERLVIELFAKDSEGEVIANPAGQTVTLAISRSEGGEPLLELSSGWSLASAPEGRFVGTFSASDLATLVEGVPYRYNIWTRESGADPLLQAKGRLMRQASIHLS